VRRRGHHLQIAVEMINIVALRLLRRAERIGRLLRADAQTTTLRQIAHLRQSSARH